MMLVRRVMKATSEQIKAAIDDMKSVKMMVGTFFHGSIDLSIEALEDKLCVSCGEVEDKCLCPEDEG
jgi:hypothetical protein